MPDEDHSGQAIQTRQPAQSQEPHGASGRPDGILAAFLRPGRGQLVVGLVLFITALLVVLTIRSQAAQPEFSNARQADLIQLLDDVTAETRRLEQQISDLERSREELASGVDRDEAARQEAARRLAQAEIIAGTVPARGPGVEISISDPEGKVSADLLLDAVEELRDAGAEVIQLNGSVRLVMRSYFSSDADGRISADGYPLTPPYEFQVIGDPATLEAGARFRGGLVSEVEGDRVGGSVTITQLELVEIDTIVSPSEHNFARPR